MKRSLVFVFGQPASGKTYAAKLLAREFGYRLYNGDRSLPRAMRKALFNKAAITDFMREAFFENLRASIRRLETKYPKLAVHQTLIKDSFRTRLSREFPHAVFLYVISNPGVREKRYAKRRYFNLGIPYLRRMSSFFEEPSVPHQVIANNKDGKKYILQQLSALHSSRKIL